MNLNPDPAALPPRRERMATLALYVIAAAGALAVLVLRVWLMSDLPMWMDETWTAVIASRAWADFWREVWQDANAPLYYIVMALWPGDGNFAMRLPSLLAMVAAPLVVLAWPAPGLSREARVAWAALLFFWSPGLMLSADARTYALALLVSTAAAIAYARLIERPDLKRATLWCALAGLAVATHYFAAWLAIVQGAFYLALHRGKALRTAPALLVLTPLAAWGLYHLPRLLVHARPDVVWYQTLSPEAALRAAVYVVGPSLFFALTLAAILAACRLLPAESPGKGVRWTAAASVVCLALVIAAGMRKPFVVDRYLTPLVPGALLGAVLLARHRIGYAALAAWYLVSINPLAIRRTLETRTLYGIEVPSKDLMPARPDVLTYSLGYEGAKILDPRFTSGIGGYFFRRAGQPIEARMIMTGKDPVGELVAAARGRRPAIILVYALDKRPTMSAVKGPEWQCRDRHGYLSGVLACVRTGSAKML